MFPTGVLLKKSDLTMEDNRNVLERLKLYWNKVSLTTTPNWYYFSAIKRTYPKTVVTPETTGLQANITLLG